MWRRGRRIQRLNSPPKTHVWQYRSELAKDNPSEVSPLIRTWSGLSDAMLNSPYKMIQLSTLSTNLQLRMFFRSSKRLLDSQRLQVTLNHRWFTSKEEFWSISPPWIDKEKRTLSFKTLRIKSCLEMIAPAIAYVAHLDQQEKQSQQSTGSSSRPWSLAKNLAKLLTRSLKRQIEGLSLGIS